MRRWSPQEVGTTVWTHQSAAAKSASNTAGNTAAGNTAPSGSTEAAGDTDDKEAAAEGGGRALLVNSKLETLNRIKRAASWGPKVALQFLGLDSKPKRLQPQTWYDTAPRSQ